ncbi:ligand-effect modulator 3 LEM3 family protein (macronuclear) [Tetrahymena thermophila SB210]|uniref:Ligand-effect modulator 3 LEM3 family protein n=1 Tax=Tetrahymena thermophila (strain SB210) TaxID=312017 RepID=Q22CJ2_TETTS|nr:ligand-effect modulator 3 LEM3 family protein [Tetrahymena thermophila SB210]EAR83000.2 ligand-effect modulator 3 LEM3 family protein [Tetrahymena thermophila SB210]|eukprot:XP_001030663.2 ligand-effect modulator 3 LEM3 family protein [Tetrahymena thermophila SB210]
MTENNTFGTMNKALKDDGDDFLNTALRKWKFNSKYKRNKLLFILLTLFFILFGSLFTYYYTQIVQVTVRYDNQCVLGTTCTFNINIPSYMSQPIFFYYQLDNFFQTHRKFYQSKDIQQLRGQDRSLSDLVSCAPFVTNADMGKVLSIGGTPLNPNDPAIPCGLIAKTFFNDTFKMYQETQSIQIFENDIAWDVDIEYNYKPTSNAQTQAWHDVTDEHFMVWMRTSGMGKFKKLWGRIKQDLPSGDYKIVVNNQYNSSDFNGYKYVLLTTSSPFGQKNLVLIVAYFSGAFVCIVSYIILLTLDKNKKDK